MSHISKKGIVILLMFFSIVLQAQSVHKTSCNDSIVPYRVIDIHEYSFKELMNEGINTLARQLDVLHVPVKKFQFVIKGHIKRHPFALNKSGYRLKNVRFRAISFSYASCSPEGEPVMLSGLVTIPVIDDNKPAKMLVQHRILAPSYTIAPSNSLPFEAVLTADNTICVFPDYYGCGITEGKNLPYVSLNYHGRCATECALAALQIVQDAGIELADDFYTWNTGYSQGGGYALAVHKYIETALPDSLSRRINLKWSLCGGGVYTPTDFYKTAIVTGNLGTTPAVFLESLRSLFYYHKDFIGNMTPRDLLSNKAIALGLDSLLLTYDDGLWDLVDRMGETSLGNDPANYFSPVALDTSTTIFKNLMSIFDLDDCSRGWHPHAPIVFYHSKKDNCVPYQQAVNAHRNLSDAGGKCTLVNPKSNGSHVFTSVFYYAKILRMSEEKLYKKYFLSKN